MRIYYFIEKIFIAQKKLCMEHNHSISSKELTGKRLTGAIILNFAITIAQIIGGILAGSLALISDAMHNFSDVVALILSGFAYRVSQRPLTVQYTFGYRRAEILAAVVNAIVLVGVSIVLIKEAITRFFVPEIPSGTIMIILGFFGFLANAGGVILLHPNIQHNLNFRSAYLHLISDAISSVVVIIGGICIRLWSLSWIDPVLTIAIAIYVLWESIDILRGSTRIIMMAAPTELSLETIGKDIGSIPSIKNVHHAHLWQLSDTDTHFEAHVCVPDMSVRQTEIILEKIETLLASKYDIHHVTIQFEFDKCPSSALLHESEDNND